MDHFPVSTFLEEVSFFEKRDFEAAWTSACINEDNLDLDLFPSNDTSFSLDNMDFNFNNSNIVDDPILTSAASLDFDNLLDAPCSPLMAVDSDADFNLSAVQDQMQEDEEDDDYPASVHSYCQPVKTEVKVEEQQIEQDDFNSNEENITPPRNRSVTSVRRSNRRRRQRRGNKRRTVSSDLDDEAAIFSNGKPKLYSQKPFNNPDLEKARLNALNAKLNREKKKQEADNLKREVERLRRENEELKKARSSLNQRANRAEEELARIKEVLEQADLVNILKWSSGK